MLVASIRGFRTRKPRTPNCPAESLRPKIFDFQNGMNLPRRRAPRMMITLFAEPTDVRADVRIWFIVFVVPQQESGHANFVRFASSWHKTVVRKPHKRGELLNSRAAPK